MKRYLSKKRLLTDDERQAIQKERIAEAKEGVDSAIATLREIESQGGPTETTEYVEVNPGEPGYEDAPFENSMIMQSRAMILEIANRPSPWTTLIRSGKYPEGLGNATSR